MKEIRLNPGEWNVMECLWQRSPQIGSDIVGDLKERVGWSRSTTLTMLRRMTEKGLIECSEDSGIRMYIPLVNREDAVRKETSDFLNRVYHGSISLLMSTFVKKQELTDEEIEELYDILRQVKGERHD